MAQKVMTLAEKGQDRKNAKAGEGDWSGVWFARSLDPEGETEEGDEGDEGAGEGVWE